MRCFTFNVSGWCNTQVAKAATEQESKEEAMSLSHGDFYGFVEVEEAEYEAVIASW
jgi:hypothetical protein